MSEIKTDPLLASTPEPDETQNQASGESTTSVPPVDERTPFAETATAAKMSGTYNKAAGFIKRTWGELTDNPELADAGQAQELLGKVHRLVGSLRGVREVAVKKINHTRTEAQAICKKHGSKLLDVASDFVDDMKKMFFK